MARIAALGLSQRLGESLAPVYALVGAEQYLVLESLRALRNAVERPDAPGSTVTEFGGDAGVGEVLGALKTVPFMGLAGQRLVVVRRAEGFVKSHADSLREYLEHPVRTSTLVLCCEKLDARSAAAKCISTAGVVVECSPLSWREAKRWLRSKARETGKKLEPAAVDTLVEALSANLFALEAELNKLVDYVGSADAIGERDVEDMVAQSRSRSVFDIADALARGELDEAVRLSQRLLLQGEKIQSVVAVLAHRVRQLWQIKRAASGRRGAEAIAGETGIQAFVVRKSMKLIGGISEEWLARSLRILAEADIESKTTSISPREEATWLQNLLARLCVRAARA